MKTLCLTLWASFLCGSAWCQAPSNTDTTGAGDPASTTTSQPDAISTDYKDIIISRLQTEPTVLDTVYYGSLSITDTMQKYKRIKAYERAGKDQMTLTDSLEVEVKDINLFIEDWHITRCFVKTDKGIFQNRAPIALLYYNQGRFNKSLPRKNDLLKFTDLNGTIFSIRAGQVLDFTPSPRHRVSLEHYEAMLKKDSTHLAYPLKAAPVADNIINFSVFTDVVGLFGEPNGLVQFEADACIPITHGNIPNTNCFLLRSVRPYFDLIRLDKEFQVTDVIEDVADGKLADSIYPRLFRQAFLIGGADLNAFTYTAGTNTLNTFVGGEFRQSKVLLANNDKQSANMISIYTGTNFWTRAFENFRVGGDFRCYFLTRLVAGDGYDRQDMIWLISSVNISYHPPFRPQSKIFLRLNYHNYPQARGNDFMQLQLGYKTPLSSKMKGVD